MRVIVYGAGAIGGVVACRLSESGHDVSVVARGAHLDAIRSSGLILQTPDSSTSYRLDAAEDLADLDHDAGDAVVMVAVKSQDTITVLERVRSVLGPTTPVVCLQNGVDNERQALRRFERVYGVPVMCPASHLEPGVVQANSTPITGIFDIGRVPHGVDDVAESIAAALSASTFESVARPDIMRWKYSKLLLNLGNAIEALCEPDARFGPLMSAVLDEGEAALRAAGIDFASAEEDEARRGTLLRMRRIDGQRRTGGSTWQSLQRGTGSIETDYLNGEIVLLGRQHGVPTPLNALLQDLAADAAVHRRPPGGLTEADLFERIGRTYA